MVGRGERGDPGEHQLRGPHRRVVGGEQRGLPALGVPHHGEPGADPGAEQLPGGAHDVEHPARRRGAQQVRVDPVVALAQRGGVVVQAALVDRVAVLALGR